MELLYENNLFVIFLIAGFTIFNLKSLLEYQQVILYYLLTFVVILFGTMRILYLLPLSLVALFFYLEYFSSDKEKMNMLIKLRYKIADFLYQIVFIYHIWGVLICLLMLYISHIVESSIVSIVFKCVSILVLFFTINIVNQRKFAVKTFTEMCKTMDEIIFYDISYSNELRKRLDILVAIEDRTYFDRTVSYNFITKQFVKIKLLQFSNILRGMTIKEKLYTCKNYLQDNIIVRGYSTLEMQLMRNIAVINGWDECRIRRKIFELIYSNIFLKSLKERYKYNTKFGMVHYKEFLLYVYCHNVRPKVGKKIQPFNEFFEKKKIEEWQLEKMLVVCVGLSYKTITEENIYKYEDIIQKFDLNKDEILKYSNTFN